METHRSLHPPHHNLVHRLDCKRILLYTDIVVKKISSSWRLSADALKLLSKISEKLGISKAAALETAIRHLAKKERID